MVMGNQQPGAGPGLGKMAEQFFGWPSPEKILAELQRLNNNMEAIQPDLRRLAKSMEGMSADDLRNLAAALNGVRVGDLLRIMNEFIHLGNQIYERLWGKR